MNLDLVPFTTYGYRIKAYNDDPGDSDYTDEIEVRTHARLAAPSNLVATSVSRSQIDLTWTDNSIGESGFKIQMRKVEDQNDSDSGDSDNLGTTSSDGSWDEIAVVGANVTSYSVVDLERSTEYEFRVMAYIDSAEAVDRLGAASAETQSGWSNEAQSDTSDHLCFITTAACDFTDYHAETP